MAVSDLVISLTSSGEVVYDPSTLVSSTTKQYTITNFGTDNLSNLGIYIIPATTIGDVDYPSDYPPETDYQDLIRWGEETTQGVALAGGLKLSIPQNDNSTSTRYITRQAGSTRTNKLSMADLIAGESLIITLEVETPPSVTTRRLYISLAIDTTP